MDIDLIVGARPNFIKISGIIKEILSFNKGQDLLNKINFRLIHTGQHYAKNLSADFFLDLNIPNPNFNLNVRSGSQSEQTARIMIRYEKLLLKKKPKICLVVGDVNSTMACAIVAKKNGILVAHVEGGLRSFDFEMPEEINRVVTDSISDYFFTTSKYANENLKKIGVNKNNIFFVGNTMIDTLKHNLKNLKKPKIWNDLDLKKNNFFLITLHRPSNVDDSKQLKKILLNVSKNCYQSKVIFPVHPRSFRKLDSKIKKLKNIYFIKPISYLNFIYLLKNTRAVFTDSGGITEEATYLNVPCLTFRNSTERPETIYQGTNILFDNDSDKLELYIKKINSNKWKTTKIPEKWDGQSSKRIVKVIRRLL